jgi:hypothetical protein
VVLMGPLAATPLPAQTQSELKTAPQKSSLTAKMLKLVGLGDKDVLKKASEQFDLTENIVKVLFGSDVAQPFGQVKDALILQRMDLAWTEGRQADFEKILFDFLVEKSQGWLLDAAFPGPINRFNLAIKLYKEKLEELRDTVVIPEYQRRMYNRYRQLRDNSASKENAFSEVCARITLEPNTTWEYILSYSGYYMLKPQLYGKSEEKWKKKHGVKEMTQTQKDKLWKDLDAFWISRLELRYQVEKNRQKLAADLLARAKDQMRKSLIIRCASAVDDTVIKTFSVDAAGGQPNRSWNVTERARLVVGRVWASHSARLVDTEGCSERLWSRPRPKVNRSFAGRLAPPKAESPHHQVDASRDFNGHGCR